MSQQQQAQQQPHQLTDRQLKILEFIAEQTRLRSLPPSVREIGAAVGLTSPSTVHTHLKNLQALGYLERDPDRTRAIRVRYDPASGAVADKSPVRHIPLVGDVAAGTDVLANSKVEELMPVPAELTEDGELFMLRVRGDSMIGAGIFDGDLVVVRSQPTAEIGQIIVAGIPGEEATVKTLKSVTAAEITLQPHNPTLDLMTYSPDEVTIYGKVVSVLRKL